ncbi:MAG: hypothetical protein ACON5H_02645 [Akkermansiaceae bacterium]
MSLTSYLAAPSRDLRAKIRALIGSEQEEIEKVFEVGFNLSWMVGWELADMREEKIRSAEIPLKGWIASGAELVQDAAHQDVMEEVLEKQVHQRLYDAGSFAKSPMVCPSCDFEIDRVVNECPRCRFSGTIAIQRYPFAAPEMECFVDPAGIFDEAAKRIIHARLEKLEKKFPQVRVRFAAVEIPEHVNLREFAFWFFNASPVKDLQEAECRPWTILLMIDPVIGRATVICGYAIEPFVDDAYWKTLLRMEHECFCKQAYKEVGLRFIEGADQILLTGAKRAGKKMGSLMREEKRGWRGLRQGREVGENRRWQ